MQADADLWGIPADLLCTVSDLDGVWPGHATAARAFVAIASQMRQVIGPAGGCVVGLDYAGAKAGLELAAITITPDDWARVRIIEAEAVKAMNGG